MSLGKAPKQRDLFRSTTSFCAPRVAETSIYSLLHGRCFELFPDELFADLFTDLGRRSVPPMVVAVVMVLQRLEGLSDREAVERFTFDARWKYAAGGLDFDYPEFVHTVLVDMRARLAASARPNRIFEVTVEIGRQAGLIGRRRVLDSSPIYDAVATMDTVTLVRSAIRGLLATAAEREAELRGHLRGEDDYASLGKPVCDYDDPSAREALVDGLAKDAQALLLALDGQPLSDGLRQAAGLLAAVVGQDLEEGDDGVFRIARRVAPDRVISTVDTDARHGRKTNAHAFDGYKGHIAIDPDAELITATTVTAGNRGDATTVPTLLETELAAADGDQAEALTVYGDSAYGAGVVLEQLATAGARARCKVQPAPSLGGRFSKDDFRIDLEQRQVTCPAGQTVRLAPHGQVSVAEFGALCGSCALAVRCTSSSRGRSIAVRPHERHIAAARAIQTTPGWQADYRATRPLVERKIAHLMRRRHGGRRARVRGLPKVAADFALLAAAVNLARLAALCFTGRGGGWAPQGA